MFIFSICKKSYIYLKTKLSGENRDTMSALAENIREKMMIILKGEEDKTDLENLAVLSRVGMKVASSVSAELDADAISASSTALIDLGIRLAEATDHGGLKEIILHNNSGYSILMTINADYIVFGGLSAVYRIGYYLGYIRELAKKLAILISGGEITEMTLSLHENELQEIKKQNEEEEAKATKIVLPSTAEDKEALDSLLGFLDDWDKEEKEAMGLDEFEDLEENNIVSIPESMMIGLTEASESVIISEEVFQESDEGVKSLEKQPEFKIYKDEVPPIPLEDYTPLDMGESPPMEPVYTEEPSKVSKPEELPPLDELPSFNDLSVPDFGSEFNPASEYDTEFILEEESEALDSVLKDLGWEEEE